MTEHLQNGAMKNHIRNIYRNISTRPEIERNDNDNVKNPKIYEGLIILK